MVPTLSPPFARVESNDCALRTTYGDCPGSPVVVSTVSETTRESKYLPSWRRGDAWVPRAEVYRRTGPVTRGDDEREGYVSYWHVYESALMPYIHGRYSFMMASLLISKCVTLILQVIVHPRQILHEIMFSRHLNSVWARFSSGGYVLVVRRARVTCLSRSDRTSPSALQPQRFRRCRGARLSGAGVHLRSHCRWYGNLRGYRPCCDTMCLSMVARGGPWSWHSAWSSARSWMRS